MRRATTDMPAEVGLATAARLWVALGRVLVVSGALTFGAALMTEHEWAAGPSGNAIGIDHPVTWMFCVASMVLWLVGGVLWAHGRAALAVKSEPAARDDWA